MDIITLLAINLLELTNEASPWLLLGLIIAGLMKSFVPTQILSKHLGEGKLAIVKAAFIGAPLPLCSCGVIPVATQLKRSGASSPATSAFLVATPETGVDSVSVSYALLGPIMAMYRPFAAILSAIFTGFLVSTSKAEVMAETDEVKSCCTSTEPQQSNEQEATTSCCASKTAPKSDSILTKSIQGIKYGFTQLIDDLIIWLFIGLLFATLVRTFLPAEFLLSYGSGLIAMLIMIAISIPMYICATASTPIAAGFILAGLSPGTALVFMMAGPATNISTLGVIKKEMGGSVLIRYLLGISISAISFGYGLDLVLVAFNISITEQMSHSHEMLPNWFALSCTILLVSMAIKPLRRLFIK
ncbi:SO_0444 family Cu/Zn efflux transporter [Thalassotalea psychrophila]|uniref:SO_0444 family Cu/Zn efflux transporter n=1 Tax=Thalassotalea psychrophila TaxID=3065647 RepID=A0ABY9TSI1_9GAMM|nr:SO_0444 family Cu/Zn efflux transporter [Colwelliaceae bacterium SQ149]